jgi:hypothetical protein
VQSCRLSLLSWDAVFLHTMCGFFLFSRLMNWRRSRTRPRRPWPASCTAIRMCRLEGMYRHHQYNHTEQSELVA